MGQGAGEIGIEQRRPRKLGACGKDGLAYLTNARPGMGQ
jgi:hypothetical protein